ncbi:hypothetical protein KQQSB11_160041 [Klebsiella quasipneumoniae subsp. quasipneumoniae]|nr:hypothetical protein KQQSB11_160041 [Klebsiella quasipneumoniae subsp. quasipneumoniae]
MPGAILNSACAGPAGASPRDGTSSIELSRPQADDREVSVVRSTDFSAGPGDCKGGDGFLPLYPFTSEGLPFSAKRNVNGKFPLTPALPKGRGDRPVVVVAWGIPVTDR